MNDSTGRRSYTFDRTDYHANNNIPIVESKKPSAFITEDIAKCRAHCDAASARIKAIGESNTKEWATFRAGTRGGMGKGNNYINDWL